MTPADRSALVAHLDALAAEATAGPWHHQDGMLEGLLPKNAAFIVALVNGYPALAAAIRDGEARVESADARADESERVATHWITAIEAERSYTAEVEAERDALAARLDAAEKVCRWVDTEVADATEHQTLRGLLDAWRVLSPSGGGHDTDTGGGG